LHAEVQQFNKRVFTHVQSSNEWKNLRACLE
jgi:hypothetical protein